MRRWYVILLVAIVLLPVPAIRAQSPSLTIYSSVDEENSRKILAAGLPRVLADRLAWGS